MKSMKIDENRCFIEYVVKPEPGASFWCLLLASEIFSKSHSILVFSASLSLWFWSSQSAVIASPPLSCRVLSRSLLFVMFRLYVSDSVRSNSLCCKLIMFQTRDVSNLLCFRFVMGRTHYVSNSVCSRIKNKLRFKHIKGTCCLGSVELVFENRLKPVVIKCIWVER